MRTNIFFILFFCIFIVNPITAWRLQLYKDKNYKRRLGDYHDYIDVTCTTGCTNIYESNINKASSMKFSSQGCTLGIYSEDNCKGERIVYTQTDWNIPKFSKKNNNRANSFKIMKW